MPPKVGSTSSRNGVGFTCSVDFGNLPTLPKRLDAHLQAALMFHLADAAQRVIDTTRTYLVRLEEGAVMRTSSGREIHGYDTGLMYVSLKYALVESLLMTGVWYDLLSEEAEYWRYVEFGHFTSGGNFWPGYHMLETAIRHNEGYIRQRVREAWADTAVALAMEAHVGGTSGALGFTRAPNLGGVANLAGVLP